MNIDFSTKPQVTIQLTPVLEAFIRLRFKTPVKQKEIVINRSLPEGQAIYSKVYPIEFPEKKPFRENPVTIILPFTKYNQSVLRFRFYHVSRMGEEQIHDELEVLMQMWLFKFFQVGYQRGYLQDQIVNAILRGLNMRKNAANYDAIKKFDYRMRRKTEDDLYKELLESCHSVC